MPIPFFGKRKETPKPPAPPAGGKPEHRGHAAVLAHLRELDQTKPEARAQLAGSVVFDLVCQMLAGERGVRIEDALAVLASVGGHACLIAAFDRIMRNGRQMTGGQLVVLGGADGHSYYFGDLPNEYLLESHLSLLSLTLGAAQAHGGAVSLEKAHEVMKHVASTVGTDQFGIPRISGPHRPGDLPFNYVKYITPKIFEALDLYETPVAMRPSAIGFAIQQAIDMGKAVLDPTIAADIVTECAVPAAKFDPKRFV